MSARVAWVNTLGVNSASAEQHDDWAAVEVRISRGDRTGPISRSAIEKIGEVRVHYRAGLRGK